MTEITAFGYKERKNMTFENIIDFVDTVRPNPFDEGTKLWWLCEAEGLVRTEILGELPESIPETVTKAQSPSATGPYIRLYSYYLIAMIDLFMSDYESYKISSEIFEKTVEAFGKWYIRHGEGR